MADLVVLIIPFIIPAVLIGSWLVNNKTSLPKKKSDGKKTEEDGASNTQEQQTKQ